jgi:hypothetical protein
VAHPFKIGCGLFFEGTQIRKDKIKKRRRNEKS